MHKHLKRRKLKKYVAWVDGIEEDEEGEIDLPIRKEDTAIIAQKHIVDFEYGKPSKLDGKLVIEVNCQLD